MGSLFIASYLICSRCCADIRHTECEGCSYYKDTQTYAIEKDRKAPKHFVARLAPELDDDIDRALMLAEAGNIVAAEFIIHSLIHANADVYTVHFAMGTIHAYKEEFVEAMQCFDKSLEIFPYFIDCWFNRALTAQRQIDILEMVASFRKVIELGDLKDEAVHQSKQILGAFEKTNYEDNGVLLDDYLESIRLFNAAFQLMQNKQWEKAIAGFKQSDKINPTSAPVFGNLALCYAYLDENEQALEAFDKAIALDAEYEPAIINKEIFKASIAKGLTFSKAQSQIKTIEYTKDYPGMGKSLAQDYLGGKI